MVESNGVIKRITQAGALANTGGNLKEFVYRLTPAEIYTIHNTPYVVLSPTAPNKYIEISVMMIEYDFKTTAYIG